MTRSVGRLGRLGGVLLALVMTLLLIPVFSGEALADTFTADAQIVDAPDTNPGNGKCDAVPETPGQQCTLRAAVQEANALDGRDTIVLTEGTYALTIPNRDSTGDLRPDPEGQAKTGDLDIRDETTIRGAGLSETTVRDEAGDRIFQVHQRALRASIAGLTVTGGNGAPMSDTSGFADPDGLTPRGGGIFNAAVLTLTNVAVRDNEADFGGGINNRGTLTMKGSTVGGTTSDGNSAFFGGGIYNEGPLTVNDSTISNNMARRGISDFGGFGGGLYNTTASARLTNSTITSNTAEVRGGGIDNEFGDVLLNNVTVFQNVSPNGISIANDGSRTYLSNTIVAKGANLVGENCVGDRTVSRGNNLSDDGSCSLNQKSDQEEGTDPRLAPIADDDDLTAVIFEPQPGSPAIDEGSNATCRPVDQRDVKRPKDGDSDGTAICDVGAVEARPPSSGV
ncbi:MAG: hypothetical protein AVDCRST_MAG78-3163 [uncultured Rubrobacteraceae bacterium]|uniref:CSLREA domain-containing protein n=1 Tax=uncultured Rubrobacteraceae bacterium TaxID=349277 RepID=A0A6J4QM33_9ACTN|nr:MAG: hypothetical protein AVDCRST_MAG78-3163 [uncultured Rubrobacteraceae bacterium]